MTGGPKGGGAVLPGATIGILGSGQLGRMLAITARRMGYRVAIYSDDTSPASTPAGDLADWDVRGRYDDWVLLERFARRVDVATTEFENVPAATLELLARHTRVAPGAAAVSAAQHRRREKELFASAGLDTVAWAAGPLAVAAGQVGYPAIAKIAAGGYDGKGQWPLVGPQDIAAVEEAAGPAELIVETRETLAAECSVLLARGHDGAVAVYPVIENHHEGGILDWSVAPARLPEEVARQASDAAIRLAEHLGYVGLLCLELFVTADGRVLANEFAPRPHNSGHLTIEAFTTSQFEQQLRAVCGLPLGATTAHRPAAMAQLLGDLWHSGPPFFEAALAQAGVTLHLYGKAEARTGRKMGHLTALADSVGEALHSVLQARSVLAPRRGGAPADVS